MNKLYAILEGFAIDAPVAFEDIQIYPLVGENTPYMLPYITGSYSTESERKSLLLKIKVLWYWISFIHYLDNGSLNPNMALKVYYNDELMPAVCPADSPPKIGGLLSRLATEDGGRLQEATQSLSWFIISLCDTSVESRVIKLYNAFGQLSGNYDDAPNNLRDYARDIKRPLEMEEPEMFSPSVMPLSEGELDRLEKEFIELFSAKYKSLYR